MEVSQVKKSCRKEGKVSLNEKAAGSITATDCTSYEKNKKGVA
jgi:hypothetical protein